MPLLEIPVEGAMLAGFVAAALATVVTPGPDTLLIIRASLTGGRSAGLYAVAGVQAGLVVHTLLAAFGLGLLIASSPALFRAVGILGALYIGWLGLSGLRGRGALSLAGGPAEISARRAFADAALTNLLNPKVILLFLALFPHFIEPQRGHVAAQSVFLGAVLIVINTLWQVPLAFAAEAARRWLLGPRTGAAIARSMGVVFIGLAVVLLFEHLS